MKAIKNNRILFLDIMRAFAVFMMIQGHTVDTFLSEQARLPDSLFYIIWYNFRGFTAPIFMFTAGVVFTYLLKIDNCNFADNSRINKGIKRGLTLIGIGYLLRYPTARFFDFRYVTPEKWSMFFAVDALHLIGFGLLFIIAIVFIAQKIKQKFSTMILITIFFITVISPFIKQIIFSNYIPEFIAAYLNTKTGSHFPFFPWLVYVFAGALLGDYLRKNYKIYEKKKFSYQLSIWGITFVAMFYILSYIQKLTFDDTNSSFLSFNIINLRLGYVLLLNGLISLLVRKVKYIPRIVIKTGRHTLLLYIVHLVMLYGSAWSLGLGYFFKYSFNTYQTIAAAIVMLLLMLLLVVTIEKVKNIKKIKLALDNT